jgi:hypothetical protein
VSLLAIGVVIGLGLGSRSETIGLPRIVAKYTGDAFWSLAVFLGVGLVWPRLSTRAAASLAVAISCAVETSQLCHAAWWDAFRDMRLVGLVLGTPNATFAWADIGAYIIGIGLGAMIEWTVGRRVSGR